MPEPTPTPATEAADATGVVVSFDKQHGFGFIRSRSFAEDVFVHARAVEGNKLLKAGQRVRFAAEPSERGPRAVRVEAGRPSLVPLAPDVAAVVGLALGVVLVTLALRFGLGWTWTWAWLLTINLATAGAFALDKRRAILAARRIPERVLLGLALLGGSPSAAAAMSLLRHKTRKNSFRFGFATVVVAQVAALMASLWLSDR